MPRTPEQIEPGTYRAVTLTAQGAARVYGGEPGATFIVDHFTMAPAGGLIAHVRDYRLPNHNESLGRRFEVLTLGVGDYADIPR